MRLTNILRLATGPALVASAMLAPAVASAAFSVTGFTTWGASDAALGVSGYHIATFEQAALPAGLTYSVSAASTLVPTGTLPNLFDTTVFDGFGNVFAQGAWDAGSHVVLDTVDNKAHPYGSNFVDWGGITFHIAGGTTSAGFSLQQIDTGNQDTLVVNGVSLGTLSALLPQFSFAGGRQGYIRVDATGGDLITSIGIDNVVAGQHNGDGWAIDHFAFAAPVPEPESVAMLLGGLCLVGLAVRRSARSRG